MIRIVSFLSIKGDFARCSCGSVFISATDNVLQEPRPDWFLKIAIEQALFPYCARLVGTVFCPRRIGRNRDRVRTHAILIKPCDFRVNPEEVFVVDIRQGHPVDANDLFCGMNGNVVQDLQPVPTGPAAVNSVPDDIRYPESGRATPRRESFHLPPAKK